MRPRPSYPNLWRNLVTTVFLTLMLASPAMAGRNANGALIVHTDDAVAYTVSADYCLTSYLPASCEAAITRTDKDEDTPAVIWLLAAFPDTSSPAVTTIQFGIEHNLPANQGYFEQYAMCGDLEMPDQGWPETGFGNLLSFGSTAKTDHLYAFYWFAAYGFQGAYLGTTTYPSTGEANFVDDSLLPVEDHITRFGSVHWYVPGSNSCPPSAGDGPNGPDGPGENGADTPGGVSDDGIPGSRESNVVLAKIEKASLAFPAGMTSVTLADAMGRADVVLADTLARVFESEAVVTMTLSVPAFNPAIIDRYGQPVLGPDGQQLKVPEDLSLWFRLTLNHDDVEGAVARLGTIPGVLSAEPNYIRKGHSPPNDPYFDPMQWGLSNHGQYCGVPGADMDFLQVWNDGYGQGVSARVGVIDSGIDLAHPDLNHEIGFNLVDPMSPPIDDFAWVWHGTACSGIIGMKGGNNQGGVGVLPGATIVPVKIIDSQGYAYQSDSAEALDWLRSAGVKVVNMSYGWPSSSRFEKESFRNARAAGMANVTSMGNDNTSTPAYPAGYSKHALAVGALTNVGDRWLDIDLPGCGSYHGSNWGSHIDLIAPGGRGIMTTMNHLWMSGYYDLSPTMDPDNCATNDWCASNGFGGTSAAAPFVAGVLGAILAHNPLMDGEDAQEVCIRTAVDLSQYGIGWDEQSGWGRPDLLAALQLVSVPNQVERGTTAGGTVQDDGSGSFTLYDVPGFTDNEYGFHRKKVTKTVNLSYPFVGIPTAWSRVQGSIGCRRIGNNEVYRNLNEDAGYAEVANVTATTITVQTWYYDVYRISDGGYAGTFPNNGNVAMSYTVLGYDPTSGVDEGGTSTAEVLRVWPNPATQEAEIFANALNRCPGMRVDLYSADGRLVRSLSPSADGRAQWNLRDDRGKRVAAGAYFLKVIGDGANRPIKLLVVR